MNSLLLGDYQRIFDVQQHQRLKQAITAAYLDILVLCAEFKILLLKQKASTARRFLLPQSPTLNAKLDSWIEKFRKHRKAVEKEAEICHMIEEKEVKDLVLRNNAAAEARERGRYSVLNRRGLDSDLSSVQTSMPLSDLS